MKKYIYTVKGLSAPFDGQEITSAINGQLMGVTCYADESSGKLTLEIDRRFAAIDEVEGTVKRILEIKGYELITPPDVDKYLYNEGNPQKIKKVPISVMIASIAITAVISILFTYVLASGFYSKNKPIIQTQNEYQQPIDISDSLDKIAILNEIFAQIQYDYKNVSQDEITEYLLKAYVAATGDKYAQYMNAEEFEQFLSSNSGENVGIGISVIQSYIEYMGKSIEVISIESVSKNSPAEANGIKKGDLIISIGTDDGEKSVNDVGYSSALDLLLGKEGTVAKFTVLRPDESQEHGYCQIQFEITRAKFDSETVFYEICSTDNMVGIVRVTEFDLKTPKQFKEAVNSLKNNGCEYFIFDLRNNPGGDLLSISAILSYFLSDGDVIISTEDSQGNTKTDYVKEVAYTGNKIECSVTKDEIGQYKDLKFAVLVNRSTASAAELFTATVKDYSLGIVVGTKTYGKGCMQQILSLSEYGIPGALRVTTKMYFSKSHTVYHDIGIDPHEYVELTDEASKYSHFERPHDVDNQLQKAISKIK